MVSKLLASPGLVCRAVGAICIYIALFVAGVMLASGISVSAQSPDSISWTRLEGVPESMENATPWVEPYRSELFELNTNLFRSTLSKAKIAEPADARTVGTEVALPMPDGTTARFIIVEAPIMEPELAANFPELKTYAGRGIDDPQATVRLDISPKGMHAQILSPSGAVYVDPAFRENSTLHVSYYKRDYPQAPDEFQCFSGGFALPPDTMARAETSKITVSGAQLRTFRLAVATTGEYTKYFGGTIADGMAAVVTAINRVDGVYETELAIRLVLVAKNNLIIYTNSTTDPYSNTSSSSLLTQNQSNLDSVIGSGNYDIGHVFSTGGGGLATLGVVCDPSRKARGETGKSSPVGDPYYIDYVAHEMGHQFGANHTFNSTTGSCSGNRESTAAYEPGSGSTIMAYAGICDANDLQQHSDPYFHAGSINEIQTYVASTSCAVKTSTGNSAPTVSAGANYTIPAGTPFVLTASGSDPQNDALTYCWEEMDLGAESSLTSADNGSSPLFRSMPPTTNTMRYFPKLGSVLANTNWNQEKLPTLSRTMTFRVTARDNRTGGGGVATADTHVTVVSSAGPFAVTAPNTPVTWSGPQTVKWNVANTSISPINAATVNIRLSDDGGNTFSYLLASNVANSGSRTITLPNIATTTARIKVEAAGNIFFDISDANFTVVPNAPMLQTARVSVAAEAFTPKNGAIDPYETVTVNWSLNNIGTGSTTNLVATLLATNGVFYPSQPQTYGAIAAGQTVTRSFTFAPSGPCGSTITALLQLKEGDVNFGSVSQPFLLGTFTSSIATQAVAKTTSITIVDNAAADPYPSTILVSGITNPVISVQATLNRFSHGYPDDVGVLLVAPNGKSVKLMDACGGGTSVTNLNLTFDDSAAAPLTNKVLISGTFRPTDLGGNAPNPPAPSAPHESTLSALGTSPNGTWSLYVQDFSAQDSGSISGGWSLQLISSNSVTTCITNFPSPAFTKTTYSGNGVEFAWSGIPGPHYQVQYRTNLSTGSWRDLGSAMLGTNVLMRSVDSPVDGPMRFYRVIVQP